MNASVASSIASSASCATTYFGRESPGARSFIEPEVSTRIATAAPSPSSTSAWYGALDLASRAASALSDRSRRLFDPQPGSNAVNTKAAATLVQAVRKATASLVIGICNAVYSRGLARSSWRVNRGRPARAHLHKAHGRDVEPPIGT